MSRGSEPVTKSGPIMDRACLEARLRNIIRGRVMEHHIGGI